MYNGVLENIENGFQNRSAVECVYKNVFIVFKNVCLNI